MAEDALNREFAQSIDRMNRWSRTGVESGKVSQKSDAARRVSVYAARMAQRVATEGAPGLGNILRFAGYRAAGAQQRIKRGNTTDQSLRGNPISSVVLADKAIHREKQHEMQVEQVQRVMNQEERRHGYSPKEKESRSYKWDAENSERSLSEPSARWAAAVLEKSNRATFSAFPVLAPPMAAGRAMEVQRFSERKNVSWGGQTLEGSAWRGRLAVLGNKVAGNAEPRGLRMEAVVGQSRQGNGEEQQHAVPGNTPEKIFRVANDVATKRITVESRQQKLQRTMVPVQEGFSPTGTEHSIVSQARRQAGIIDTGAFFSAENQAKEWQNRLRERRRAESQTAMMPTARSNQWQAKTGRTAYFAGGANHIAEENEVRLRRANAMRSASTQVQKRKGERTGVIARQTADSMRWISESVRTMQLDDKKGDWLSEIRQKSRRNPNREKRNWELHNHIEISGNDFHATTAMDPDELADQLGRRIVQEIENSASGGFGA